MHKSQIMIKFKITTAVKIKGRLPKMIKKQKCGGQLPLKKQPALTGSLGGDTEKPYE